jgi:hypothetical protein
MELVILVKINVHFSCIILFFLYDTEHHKHKI